MNGGMLECDNMDLSEMWQKFNIDDKKDFCRRHQLSTLDQDVCIVCISKMLINDKYLIKLLGIQWLETPLLELELHTQWGELEIACEKLETDFQKILLYGESLNEIQQST